VPGVPEAVFIEARVLGAHPGAAPLLRARIIHRVVAGELPLAGHHRSVPGVFQVMAEGARLWVEQPEADPVAVSVSARHHKKFRRSNPAPRIPDRPP